MNSILSLALLTLIPWFHAASCVQAQEELPPVFSKLDFDKALEANKTDGKILIVKSTASWCAPCKQMDRTTWRDPKVVSWFEANGVAIQFDVDKETALAKKLDIQAMPTMIAFRKAEEFDRIVGYRDATDFVAWLDGVKNGKKSIEAVRARAQEATKGSEEEIKTRYDLAKHLVQSGELDKASEEYVWLWTHAPGTSYGPVRSSFMASDIGQLAGRHAPTKQRFVQFRDESAKQLQGEKIDREVLDDWLVLNDVIGESKVTLEWFHKVKTEERWLPMLRSESYRLEAMLIADELWTDVALLHPDPVADLKKRHEMNAMSAKFRAGRSKELGGTDFDEFDRESLRGSAGQLYASMLAAGRNEEAQAVVTQILDFDDSSAARLELVERALQAKQPRAGQSALLDQAETKGEAKKAASLRAKLEKELAR
ncbi:MAG TPA: thioredoxin family protein [Planctomycetota bacterium]|nr:thioredoxin family protein [Planctomycetota bacterium]